MSSNVPFPYVSYKGQKYADPHAAAKAFLLDTDKKQNDTLNIHDISDTSSIDGAGVDLNGKIWTNNYSFQDNTSLINLKTAMKDVFASIKEVMARDKLTLEEVAQKPLNVRPFYAYNGQRYENPEEALSALYNDPNKTPNQSSVMYHNRFDGGGIELAGVGPNKEMWYTQLSDYSNIPAVKAGRAIYEQMITEAPVVTATNSVEAVNKVEAFKPYFSLDGTKYESGKEAMQAFLDKPSDQRYGGVTLHNKNNFSGIQMAGQSDNFAKTVWVEQMSDNNHIPEVVAARKEMNEVLNAHNIKFPPMDPNSVAPPKVVEAFKPYFKFDGVEYSSGKEAMQAFLDNPDKRFGGVMLHNKNDFGGIEMAGQSHNISKTIWINRMSDNDENPIVVAARKEMNEVLDAHNIKFPPMDPNTVEPPKVVEAFQPYFKLDGVQYTSGKEAMQAFLDKPVNERYSGVVLHTKNDFSGIEMAGQSHDSDKTVWVDRMSHNNSDPLVVAARKEMNEVLTAHNNAIDFNAPEITSNKQPEFPYFKYDNKVYSNANDVMKVFIADRDNNTIKSDVLLHVDSHFSSVDAAGRNLNGDVWKNQYSFQDHPAMKDFKNAFDKEVNGYKANLQYLDDVYADNAKCVEGYPRELQISDMKEMKKIIDKLPTHNVSDSDLIKITSYKNDIKNHELSVFLDDGTKNNDVKVKNNNNNTLKIS